MVEGKGFEADCARLLANMIRVWEDGLVPGDQEEVTAVVVCPARKYEVVVRVYTGKY